MENARRHFLRTISGVAALPAIGSVLTREPRTGLGAASSTDLRGQDHGIRPLFEFSSVAAGGAAHGSDAPYLGCQRRRTSAARPVGHAPFEANEDGDVSARFECPWRDQPGVCERVHRAGAVVLVVAAQSVPHFSARSAVIF